ncbi:hypothetical protein BZL41_04990 [Pseudomonas sp. PIC25]|nr:hypothetical protein BZL41_04990 [Pseudomonas sp. PIC25]
MKDEVLNGASTKRVFNANGSLLEEIVDGVKTSFTYDSQGNLATKTMPRGIVHSFSDYHRGIAQTESQEEGVFVYRNVDDAGNVISETNGEGHTTYYEYDALNRVLSISYPSGNPRRMVYGLNNETATRGSLIESVEYDGFGRPKVITKGNVVTTYKHDGQGRKIYESNPDSSVGTSYKYDALNRIVLITYADGMFKKIAYGAGTQTITDERGKTIVMGFRSYGDPNEQYLIALATPESESNIIMNRNVRNLITLVHQGGVTRKYGYNENFYLTSIDNPETGVTTYERDMAGNIVSSKVGTSPVTIYSYDKRNRLTNIDYPGDTASVINTYTKTDKVLTSLVGGIVRRYSYDPNDNLIEELLEVDGGKFSTNYYFNSNDQLEAIKYPVSGRVINYSPDVLGRPTRISGFINRIEYWSSGQFKLIEYVNGVFSRYDQNARLWPGSFQVGRSNSLYANSAYGYDGQGNLTSIVDSIDSRYNRTLVYDGVNRLVGATGPWGNGNITYSGAGNIKRKVYGQYELNYSYDSANRLSAISGSLSSGFSYDIYGNVIGGYGKVYKYDGAQNLVCVDCASGNAIRFSYDGSNKRVVVSKGNVKTYEIYSKDTLLVEYSLEQPSKLVEYIYLDGKRVAQVVNQ